MAELLPMESIDAIISSDETITSTISSTETIDGRVSSSDEINVSLDGHSEINGEVTVPQVFELNMDAIPSMQVELTIPPSRGGEGGTNDYEELINKPKINSVTLIKNKTFGDLGLNALSNMELEQLLS